MSTLRRSPSLTLIPALLLAATACRGESEPPSAATAPTAQDPEPTSPVRAVERLIGESQRAMTSGDLAGATRLAREAVATAAAGDDVVLHVRSHVALVGLEIAAGKHDAAATLIDLLERHEAALPVQVRAEAAYLLGEAELARKQFEVATRRFESVLALYATAPREVPILTAAGSQNALGLIALDERRMNEAREAFRRAVELLETTDATGTPNGAALMSKALGNLAVIMRRSGELDTAREHYERALAMREAAVGKEHPVLVVLLFNYGVLLLETDDATAALAQFDRALAIGEPTFGVGAQQLAATYVARGRALRALDRGDEAKAMFARVQKAQQARSKRGN